MCYHRRIDRKRKVKEIILLFLLLGCWFPSVGQTPLSSSEINNFKKKMEKATQDISSIRTDFEQSKHLSFLSNVISSKGKMFLNAEGYLKWAYTSPNKYSIIFKNNMIYINDNGNKRKMGGNQKIFKQISHLISGSISGKLFKDKNFEINYYKENNQILVVLVPKNESIKKYIASVKLYFPFQQSMVDRVQLMEPSGDYTMINFMNREINVEIDPNIFNQ